MESTAQNLSSSRADSKRIRGALVFGLLCSIVVLAFDLRVRSQGLDFLRDGIWLLSASLLDRGQALYRHLVTREGPLDAELLRLVFFFLGEKAAALALLKAIVDSLAAGLCAAWAWRAGKRSLAWIAPLGVVVLAPFPPRYVMAGLAAALLQSAIALGRGDETGQAGARRGIYLLLAGAGLILGLTAVSGLDGFLLAALLSWGALSAFGRELESLRTHATRLLLLGAAVPFLVVLLLSLLEGNLAAGLDQVLLTGVSNAFHQIASFSFVRLGNGMWSAREALSPFKSLMTGETLPELFPAAPLLRVLSFRLQNLLLFACVLWAWSKPAFRQPRMRPLMVLATAPLVGTVLHGDAMHSHRAWLGVLILLPLLLSEVRRPMLRAGTALCLVLVVWSLPILENSWLVANSHRAGLRWWQRPRAGIALESERVSKIDSLFSILPLETSGEDEPLLVWPDAPALNFLMDAPLVLPQAVLLPRRVRHGERLAEQLEKSAPLHVLLGLSWNYTGEQVEELAPGCWDYLRENYRVLGNVVSRNLKFRVLERMQPTEKLSELTLPQRLPDVEQSVGNGVSPALRTNFEVGQSFRVGPRDLEGFAVRWGTDADSLMVGLRIRIWKWENGGWNRLMEIYELDVPIHGNLYRSFLRFGPVEDSARQLVAITFELKEDPGSELRLVWHDDKDGAPDLYPEGSALVELKPQPADLYFFSW